MTPPPQDPAYSVPAKSKVDPTFAWSLAFAPLLIAVFPYVARGASELVGLAAALGLNIGLALADRARLAKAGIAVKVAWAIFLVPGYLIVRTIRAGSTPAIPVVWFVTFFVSLAIPAPAHTASVTMDSHKVEQQ